MKPKFSHKYFCRMSLKYLRKSNGKFKILQFNGNLKKTTYLRGNHYSIRKLKV